MRGGGKKFVGHCCCSVGGHGHVHARGSGGMPPQEIFFFLDLRLLLMQRHHTNSSFLGGGGGGVPGPLPPCETLSMKDVIMFSSQPVIL